VWRPNDNSSPRPPRQIYDLVRSLVEALGERDVELLLLLLRHAGGRLRADDPAALKDIVRMVQVRRNHVGFTKVCVKTPPAFA
jgi:nucleolar MIF4G domain-containing protein 1